MLIAITNSSTKIQNSDVEIMCKAAQIQLDIHVAPAFGAKSSVIKFYSDAGQIPNWAWVITLIDDDTSVPNALGYHTESFDKVQGFVMVNPVLQNNGVILYDQNNPQNISVSSVLSHEILETFFDRYCGFWADGPAIAQGSEYSCEICDPVQGDSYVINVSGTNVSVSNFVFEAWFNAQAKAPDNMPFDFLKKLTGPFQMSKNGYMVVRNGPGTEQQVFGELMPEWQKEIKKKEFSRASRRCK